MPAPNNAQFINHMILLFIGAAIPISILSFINGSINWIGLIVIAVVIIGLLIYRGQLNKKSN